MRASLLTYIRGTVARARRSGAAHLAVALLAVAVAVSWTPLAARGGDSSTAALYTLAQLSTQLTEHPGPWVGQVVQVRAVAVVVPLWVSHEMLPFRLMVARLVDPDGRGGLPLVFGPEDRVLGALRRLPLLGELVPPPQVRVWERPTIYRIRLEVARGPGDDPYAAVLLDTQPDD
jgi:hypothetical protein